MKLLVIGGTQFSGTGAYGAGARARPRGHAVPQGQERCGAVPRGRARPGDREEGFEPLGDREFDAVVDTCGYVPRSVGAAVERLQGAGWYGYISSISAFASFDEPGMTEASPLHGPPFPDTEEITETTYGPLKVACEQQVTAAFGDRAALIRPGYIVGPHDPTDRFTYWIRRGRDRWGDARACARRPGDPVRGRARPGGVRAAPRRIGHGRRLQRRPSRGDHHARAR